MRKALIYGLALSIALALTACGQPKAEEPGAPDPAASAAVQTASPEETTEPTATPEPSEETPTAPAETDAQPDEDTATEPPAEDTTPEQPPEDPGETVSTQPLEETTPTTKPTQQTTKPSGETTIQTPPSSSTTYDTIEQVMLESLKKSEEDLAEQGYNSAHGELTDSAMEAIGSALSGGTPTIQPDTDSQDGTDRPQTPPDSGSIESDNVRTPAQTAAEDWLRQQATGGSSDYTGGRDFTEEEIADIGSKLNVTD